MNRLKGETLREKRMSESLGMTTEKALLPTQEERAQGEKSRKS